MSEFEGRSRPLSAQEVCSLPQPNLGFDGFYARQSNILCTAACCQFDSMLGKGDYGFDNHFQNLVFVSLVTLSRWSSLYPFHWFCMITSQTLKDSSQHHWQPMYQTTVNGGPPTRITTIWSCWLDTGLYFQLTWLLYRLDKPRCHLAKFSNTGYKLSDHIW